jgi:hypothetical protein
MDTDEIQKRLFRIWTVVLLTSFLGCLPAAYWGYLEGVRSKVDGAPPYISLAMALVAFLFLSIACTLVARKWTRPLIAEKLTIEAQAQTKRREEERKRWAQYQTAHEKAKLNQRGLRILILKEGGAPRDERWYIEQVLESIGAFVHHLSSGTQIDNIRCVSREELGNTSYLMGLVSGSGYDPKFTRTPFADGDGGSGVVIKMNP